MAQAELGFRGARNREARERDGNGRVVPGKRREEKGRKGSVSGEPIHRRALAVLALWEGPSIWIRPLRPSSSAWVTDEFRFLRSLICFVCC